MAEHRGEITGLAAMSALLRVDIAEEVHRLDAPEPVLDPATSAVVEQATTDAYERGRRDGEQAGRAAALEQARRATAAITEALAALQAEAVEQRDQATTATLELAVELASEVLDAAPPPEATTVLTRVREAAEVLDDSPLEVRLHPEDHRALGEMLVEPRLQLIPDASIVAGDAQLVGRWGGAALTRAGLLSAVVAARQEET